MPDAGMVDPQVSRAKFEREVAYYRALETTFRAQGRFLVDATFPEAFAVFATAHVTPPSLIAGVVIDFTDYDVRPPSVTFVDPLTREPILEKERCIRMFRRPPGLPPEALAGLFQQGIALPDMIQAFGPEERPFLCLPGVREYHDNAAHTGDPWLLHRGSSEGSLAYILEKIWSYGTNPVTGYQIALQPVMTKNPIVNPAAIPA